MFMNMFEYKGIDLSECVCVGGGRGCGRCSCRTRLAVLEGRAVWFKIFWGLGLDAFNSLQYFVNPQNVN